MATSLAADLPSLASQSDQQNDPFLSSSTGSNHHRFSHFDNQLFALGPTTSPDQAKRALEAHLAETERLIQEASKLGTTLVQQRKDLAERLKEVEKQQIEGDITPELRQKLVEIEKEYNEVGRESARAFLPKSRVPSNEMGGSPFAGDTKVILVLDRYRFKLTCYSALFPLLNSRAKLRTPPPNSVCPIESSEINPKIVYMISNLQLKSAHLCCHKYGTFRLCWLRRRSL